MNVSVDVLYQIIGMKDVEILELRQQIAELQAAYTDIKNQLEARDASTSGVGRS